MLSVHPTALRLLYLSLIHIFVLKTLFVSCNLDCLFVRKLAVKHTKPVSYTHLIIDNDKVCLTNINRQIIATTKTVGKYKVDVAKERIEEINPDCKVAA